MIRVSFQRVRPRGRTNYLDRPEPPSVPTPVVVPALQQDPPAGPSLPRLTGLCVRCGRDISAHWQVCPYCSQPWPLPPLLD